MAHTGLRFIQRASLATLTACQTCHDLLWVGAATANFWEVRLTGSHAAVCEPEICVRFEGSCYRLYIMCTLHTERPAITGGACFFCFFFALSKWSCACSQCVCRICGSNRASVPKEQLSTTRGPASRRPAGSIQLQNMPACRLAPIGRRTSAAHRDPLIASLAREIKMARRAAGETTTPFAQVSHLMPRGQTSRERNDELRRRPLRRRQLRRSFL